MDSEDFNPRAENCEDGLDTVDDDGFDRHWFEEIERCVDAYRRGETVALS